MRFRTDGMRTLEGKAAFRLLFGCLLTVGMGNSMLLAVLPALSRTLGLPDAAVGVIFSFSAVLWVITSPLWGRASDRLGRKRLIVFGLAAYAASQAAFVAVILLGLAGHWEAGVLVVALTLARALFGAGGSATSPAAQAWVAERTEPAARMSEIAALTSAFAFGSAAGPAIAAILVATVGLTAPLILAGVTAAAGAVAAQRLLAPDAPAADAPRPEGGPAWALAREPHVLRYLIFAVLLSAVTAMTSQTLAFTVIDRLDLSPARGAELTAVAFAAAALAQIVAQIGLIPRLSLTPRMLMTVGAGVAALGALCTVAGPTFGAIAAGQILMGLGAGLARPGFTVGASLAVPEDRQGGVAGLVVSANGAGFIIAPVLGTGLYQITGPLGPWTLATVVLAAMTAMAFTSRTLREPPVTAAPERAEDL
jgi:MFS family permease